jgi:hypothetical protein
MLTEFVWKHKPGHITRVREKEFPIAGCYIRVSG